MAGYTRFGPPPSNLTKSAEEALFSGGIGTLNGFTIADDEGKVIGLLQGAVA